MIIWFSLDWMPTLDLEEAEHVMFLKFVERLRLIWRSGARDSSSWLNAYAWFEEAEHVMFLESWKKVYIFKGASIFESGQLQELGSPLVFGRILLRPYRVKKFQPLQMRIIHLFIEFTGGLYGLKPGWSMDQTYELNHMDLSYI